MNMPFLNFSYISPFFLGFRSGLETGGVTSTFLGEGREGGSCGGFDGGGGGGGDGGGF